MIKRVEIKGFRSCKKVVLDNLGGMTALIGRNATGKTAILKAIEWAARAATDPEFQGSRLAVLSDRPFGMILEIQLHNTFFRYRCSLKYKFQRMAKFGTTPFYELVETRSRAGEWVPLLRRERSEYLIFDGESPQRFGTGTYHSLLNELHALLPDHRVTARVRPLRTFLQNVRYYSFDEPNDSLEGDLITGEIYQKWLSQYESTKDPGTRTVMKLLHWSLSQERQKVDDLNDLKNLLGENGLGIIDRIDISPLNVVRDGGQSTRAKSSSEKGDYPLYEISFIQSWRAGGGNEPVPFSRLSQGTRRILRILVSSFFDASNVMLIEHPEDAIHFGLARKLVSLLRSDSHRVQTILTSHSSDILNVMRPNEVRLVTINGGATSVRALDRKELKVAENYIKEEGTLTDFLRLLPEE